MRPKKIVYPVSDKVKIVQFTDEGKLATIKRIKKLHRVMKESAAEVVIPFLPIISLYTLIANIGLRKKVIMSERADPRAQFNNLPWKDKIGNFFMRKCGLYSLADAILFFVWLFLAVYRYVGYEGGIIIGGNDAPTYIDYFQTCLAGKGNNIYFVRTEPLFQIMTKAVRTITSNYHVYFALIYGLIIFSYLRFIDEFDLLQSSKTPLFMLVFPFIQSFCAIRTHITIALILLAIVALKNRRNILMWGLLIASVFIQRASLIYAIFPIFYFYYKKNKMTVKKAIAFVIIGCAVGYIGKKVIIGGSIGYLTGGVYANYASASSSAGYLFDYIKLIVEQVIIDGYMILSYKKVNGQLQEMEKLEKEKLRMLQMMCYFDFMLIPICYILGIWRGASYFFLPRLLILGYIISDFSMKISKNSRKVYYMIVKVVMPIWLVLRLFTVYDVSGLMPYYLDFRL